MPYASTGALNGLTSRPIRLATRESRPGGGSGGSVEDHQDVSRSSRSTGINVFQVPQFVAL